MRHLKYLGVLLILLVPALLFSAGAESGSCGPDLRWDLDDSGRLTVSGTGPMDDFGAKEAPWGTEITSAVLEDGVTSVGGYAFYQCKSLAGLSLPEGITFIGRAAFLGCESLAGLTLPDSVRAIGDYAFDGCTGLTGRVTLPDGVTRVGGFLFFGCGGLEAVDIPDSVRAIGMWAFYGCRSLQKIAIPAEVSEIGSRAFLGCPAVRIASCGSAAAKALGKAGYAFRNTDGQDAAYIYTFAGDVPSGLTLLEAGREITAFAVPDGVTEIGDAAFLNCTRLAAVALPEGLRRIGQQAFAGCAALRQIVIPRSTLQIGEDAFSGTGLILAMLPSWLENIGENAFSGNPGMVIACYGGSLAQSWAEERGFAVLLLESTLKYLTLTLPEGLTEIESGAFQDVRARLFVLPAAAAAIAEDAFPPDAVLSVAAGSPAEAWARAHGYNAVRR